MPGFLDKFKEAVSKGLSELQKSAEVQRLLADFDEHVASIITDILVEQGYQPLSQKEEGDRYVIRLGIPGLERIKAHVDRDLMRAFSPRDREKIRNIVPNELIITVRYLRRAGSPLASKLGAHEDDTVIEVSMSYFVEKEGGFLSRGLKRQERKISLGRIGFNAYEYVDREEPSIMKEELRKHLEARLRGLGLI